MIANRREPARPRAKRKPSPRNMQIFQDVRVLGQRQADVATRHGLSQRRISAICAQVDEWHRWTRIAPNADEIADERRRTILLECRKRAEWLYTRAVKQAAQQYERLVCEVRRIEGGQEAVERTVREVPIEADWLKTAARLSSDILRINERLGPDAESSFAGHDVDALLAELASENEGERAPVGEGEPKAAPNEGVNYSSCSTVNGSLGQVGPGNSAANSAASRDMKMVYSETNGDRLESKNNGKNARDQVFYGPEKRSDPAGDSSTQIAQIARTKLPQEVRERRARFLQSLSEPKVDTMGLGGAGFRAAK